MFHGDKVGISISNFNKLLFIFEFWLSYNCQLGVKWVNWIFSLKLESVHSLVQQSQYSSQAKSHSVDSCDSTYRENFESFWLKSQVILQVKSLSRKKASSSCQVPCPSSWNHIYFCCRSEKYLPDSPWGHLGWQGKKRRKKKQANTQTPESQLILVTTLFWVTGHKSQAESKSMISVTWVQLELQNVNFFQDSNLNLATRVSIPEIQ